MKKYQEKVTDSHYQLKNSVSWKRRLISIAGAAIMTGVAGTALAASPWTSVGSAGVVDEADLSEFFMSSGYTGILPAAPANSSITLRYNVTATGDLENGGVNKRLSARFRDNGPGARVRLYLREYNYLSGTTTTLLSLDSDTVAPSAGFQTLTVSDGCFSTSFNFTRNAYYIEAILSRTTASGTPNLAILRVEDADVC
ncbi:hypothetical protein BTA51_07100 [Hahella sp. CCB-MM4]|uniref:hypothetical protein n=1 Tax=Hahella sp. (strain CCB-MM4) TaxID=1926491 RepID=UPI000B9AE156|nr:hypothetical protein [Hahella sp. CCB-MM4]OZG74733.1 hypothetical protein BTA51_07100 [Hahella sp. CCB-MM4]